MPSVSEDNRCRVVDDSLRLTAAHVSARFLGSAQAGGGSLIMRRLELSDR